MTCCEEDERGIDACGAARTKTAVVLTAFRFESAEGMGIRATRNVLRNVYPISPPSPGEISKRIAVGKSGRSTRPHTGCNICNKVLLIMLKIWQKREERPNVLWLFVV